MRWTTIRDVRAALADSLGGHAACQAMNIEARVLTDAASAAWHAAGCGRYEDADEDVQSAVIERAHLALAPGEAHRAAAEHIGGLVEARGLQKETRHQRQIRQHRGLLLGVLLQIMKRARADHGRGL